MTDNLNTTPASAPHRAGLKRVAVTMLALLTALGFVARVTLSWFSLGSDDWGLWHGFAQYVQSYGLFTPYQINGDLNHPPLALAWSWVALRVASVTGTTFPFVFRMATIAGDAGCCLILGRIVTRKSGGILWGWVAAAAFAWNLNAILDGAFHCNTDNLCAFFTLLAAYQLGDRRNFFLGGLALGAAINVKIVPILLLPAFFSLCLDWKSARQLFKGLMVATLPFLVVICVTPRAFIHNVFGYNSIAGAWGLVAFPIYAAHIKLLAASADSTLDWYRSHGRYVLLALSAALGIVSWRLRRWNAYEVGALGWCVFMIFTPGWGPQYSVYVAPLLMAASLGRGSLYGLVGGLYLLSAYAGALKRTLPLQSIFMEQHTANELPFGLGLLAWGILVSYFFTTLSRGLSRDSANSRPLWLFRGS